MIYRYITVPDPDIEISWQGEGVGQSPRPLDKGGGGSFEIFQASVWSKNKGGRPPGPSHGSATVLS